MAAKFFRTDFHFYKIRSFRRKTVDMPVLDNSLHFKVNIPTLLLPRLRLHMGFVNFFFLLMLSGFSL